jgi:(2Fe-2S) ferredoxin
VCKTPGKKTLPEARLVLTTVSATALPLGSIDADELNWIVPKFDKHIFICMNQREEGHPRGCCDPTGQGELQRLFKTKLAQRGIKNVRANKSGCLDQCELGPTVVVYPEAVWYGSVKPEDVAEIIESHIVNGRPVERLIIPDAILNTTHKK